MSPRRNRRERPSAPLDTLRALRGVAAVQRWQGRDWTVWTIPGGASDKTYRCPGCDHEIQPGVAHVVVWPADETDRRHWHRACWQARDRRGPAAR